MADNDGISSQLILLQNPTEIREHRLFDLNHAHVAPTLAATKTRLQAFEAALRAWFQIATC